MKDIDKTPGERLKLIRKDTLNIKSSYDIAEQLGISQSTYVSYELGRMDMNVSFLTKMHEKFGIMPDFIALGKGSPKGNPDKNTSQIPEDLRSLKSKVLALEARLEKLARKIK
ncbi:helix-turn-helix domain-containing protein [Pedobacter duraquae]|uniref:Helix-turn-helix protein n=1 Tax=Pedobacter duraquae TaxID=425511 RepID=A0A4R6IJ30_9SPHI|nr:helix-turn-helix transcriptional regulator [Pedobacter duraquae]TDO21935.1 helix-turn-helix protein [Pedobacter duraquae]